MNEEMIKLMDDAPNEIKEATIKLHQAVKRERKAELQLRAWRQEFELANQMRKCAEKEYGSVSLRWDVEKNTMQTLEEISL